MNLWWSDVEGTAHRRRLWIFASEMMGKWVTFDLPGGSAPRWHIAAIYGRMWTEPWRWDLNGGKRNKQTFQHKHWKISGEGNTDLHILFNMALSICSMLIHLCWVCWILKLFHLAKYKTMHTEILLTQQSWKSYNIMIIPVAFTIF